MIFATGAALNNDLRLATVRPRRGRAHASAWATLRDGPGSALTAAGEQESSARGHRWQGGDYCCPRATAVTRAAAPQMSMESSSAQRAAGTKPLVMGTPPPVLHQSCERSEVA